MRQGLLPWCFKDPEDGFVKCIIFHERKLPTSTTEFWAHWSEKPMSLSNSQMSKLLAICLWTFSDVAHGDNYHQPIAPTNTYPTLPIPSTAPSLPPLPHTHLY